MGGGEASPGIHRKIHSPRWAPPGASPPPSDPQVQTSRPRCIPPPVCLPTHTASACRVHMPVPVPVRRYIHVDSCPTDRPTLPHPIYLRPDERSRGLPPSPMISLDLLYKRQVFVAIIGLKRLPKPQKVERRGPHLGAGVFHGSRHGPRCAAPGASRARARPHMWGSR